MSSTPIAPHLDEIEKHPNNALTGYNYFAPTEAVMKDVVNELFLGEAMPSDFEAAASLPFSPA